MRLAECTDFLGALHQCIQMRDEGIKPDIMTYHYLLSACSRAAMGSEAWAILEDMQLMGLKPDRQIFIYLLNVKWSVYSIRKAQSRLNPI
jgi:pentatricopeptide repeat protein